MGKSSLAGAPPPKEMVSGEVMDLKSFSTTRADFSMVVIRCANFGIEYTPFSVQPCKPSQLYIIIQKLPFVKHLLLPGGR